MKGQVNKESSVLRKLLSFRGIFLIYNFREICRYSPFWIGSVSAISFLIFSISEGLDQKRLAVFLLQKIDDLYPNLLGFSLGGYAIIVSFGSTDFLRRIAKSQSALFSKLNAIFAFSILLQITVLFISFIAEVLSTLSEPVYTLSFSEYQVLNGVFNLTAIFLVIWSLALLPYVVVNIFVFGQSHHELLKNGTDEKG